MKTTIFIISSLFLVPNLEAARKKISDKTQEDITNNKSINNEVHSKSNPEEIIPNHITNNQLPNEIEPQKEDDIDIIENPQSIDSKIQEINELINRISSDKNPKNKESNERRILELLHIQQYLRELKVQVMNSKKNTPKQTPKSKKEFELPKEKERNIWEEKSRKYKERSEKSL